MSGKGCWLMQQPLFLQKVVRIKHLLYDIKVESGDIYG